MIIEAIILSLILIKFTKGDYKNLRTFDISDIRGKKTLLIGIFLILIANICTSTNIRGISDFCVRNYYYIHILSILSIAIGLFLNRKNPGLLIMSVGFILNLISIVINKKMPVSREALMRTKNHNMIYLLNNGYSLSHGLFKNPKLKILSDIIPLPPPYYNPKVISIGDILITLGVVIAIVFIARRNSDYDRNL